MPTARSLHVSRLAALADAGFYPTSAQIQQRLPNLVTFPTRGHYTVLDLTCGEGDFLAPFDGPLADLYGVEINGVRASRARTRLPHAFIVHPQRSGESGAWQFPLLLPEWGTLRAPGAGRSHPHASSRWRHVDAPAGSLGLGRRSRIGAHQSPGKKLPCYSRVAGPR